MSTSRRPGCLPFPLAPRTKSPFSPLPGLYFQTLGTHSRHLLPSAFHQTAHSSLRLLLSPSFGRKLSAMVPLTLSIRIRPFPLEPTAPSWQTRYSNQSIPREGHPRLPIEPCGEQRSPGDRVVCGWRDSLPISFGICPGGTMSLTGLGYKRH